MSLYCIVLMSNLYYSTLEYHRCRFKNIDAAATTKTTQHIRGPLSQAQKNLYKAMSSPVQLYAPRLDVSPRPWAGEPPPTLQHRIGTTEHYSYFAITF